MKKQRKPRSKPQKQKARSAPLPLDTSRRHPTAPKSASSPTRNAASRRHSTANRQHGLRTVVGMIWSRLAATSRSDRADAAMLALPVLLIGLTIGVARWTNADLATREFATITPGAKHALNGLPPVATPVSPLLPAPAAATVPRQTSMPVLAAPIAEATPAELNSSVSALGRAGNPISATVGFAARGSGRRCRPHYADPIEFRAISKSCPHIPP